MTRVIWKETLSPNMVQELMLPVGAHVLCAREQYDLPCIWFECDPDAVKEPRRFLVLGTGGPGRSGDSKDRYLGTVALFSGTLMFHVFEVATVSPTSH